MAVWDPSMPQEDRIRARITDIVRSRGHRAPEPPSMPPAARIEPPLVRSRGPVPLMADTRTAAPRTAIPR